MGRSAAITWLRSALFYLAAWTQSLGVATAILTVGWFAGWRERYRLFRLWSRLNCWLLATLCGLKVQIIGRERLPVPPFVIVSNHQSAWEIMVLGALFPPFAWVAKRSLLQVPVVGWAFGRLDPITIDRKRKGRALRDVIRRGRDHLSNGTCIVVFPEGTRSRPGELGEFHGGGAYLVQASGVPAVPIFHNAGDFWPAKRFVILPGTIRLHIGKAIMPNPGGTREARPLMHRLHEEMRAMASGPVATVVDGSARPSPGSHAAPTIE